MKKLEKFNLLNNDVVLNKSLLKTINGGLVDQGSDFCRSFETTCVDNCSDGHWEHWKDGVCIWNYTSPISNFDCP